MNFHVIGIPISNTNRNYMHKVMPTLHHDDIFLESKNMYFGTFTLVNISALFKRDVIPSLVDSLKNENTSCPENK